MAELGHADRCAPELAAVAGGGTALVGVGVADGVLAAGACIGAGAGAVFVGPRGVMDPEGAVTLPLAGKHRGATNLGAVGFWAVVLGLVLG